MSKTKKAAKLVESLRDPSNSGSACKVMVLEAADTIEDLLDIIMSDGITKRALADRLKRHEPDLFE